MKFRKKPIVIDAEQYQYFKDIPGVNEIRSIRRFNDGGESEIKIIEVYVDTLEGRMEVHPGDWIITGVNGEKYPCNPDVFEKTYEKI